MLPLILSSTQLKHTTASHILHSRIIKTKKKKMQRLLELLSTNRTRKPKRKFSHPIMVN